MSITKNNTQLFTSGEIKFRDLRDSFKETNSGSISARELLRDTSIDSLDPIVPDCTENNGISAANDLSLLSFRNSIKYYNLDQSGTYTNLDIDAQDWNSNLSKNIVKTFKIAGTLGSNDPTKPSASLEGEARNLKIRVINGHILGAGGEGGPFVDKYNATVVKGQDGGTALYLNTTANELWFTHNGSYSTDRPEVENFSNIDSYDAAGNLTGKKFEIKNISGSFSIIANQNSEGLSIGEKLYIYDSDIGDQGAPDIEITVAAVNLQWVEVYTNSDARIWGGGGGGGQGGTGQTGGQGGGTVNYPGGQGAAGGLGGKGGTGRGYNNLISVDGSSGQTGNSGTGSNTKTWKDAKPATMNDSSGSYYSPRWVNANSPANTVSLSMKGSGWQSSWVNWNGNDSRNSNGESYREVEVHETDVDSPTITTRDALFHRHEYNTEWNNRYAPFNIMEYGGSYISGKIDYNTTNDLGWYYCGTENSIGEKTIAWKFTETENPIQVKNGNFTNDKLCLRDEGESDCNGSAYARNKNEKFQVDGNNVTGHVAGLNWDTKTFTSGTGGDGGTGGEGGDGSDWGQKGSQGGIGLDGTNGNDSSNATYLKTKNPNVGSYDTDVQFTVSIDSNAQATDLYVHNRFYLSENMDKDGYLKIECEDIRDGSKASITFNKGRVGSRWQLGYDTAAPYRFYPNTDYLVRGQVNNDSTRTGQFRINSSNNKILEWDDNAEGRGDDDFNDLILTTYRGFFVERNDGKFYWRYESPLWAWGLFGIDDDSNIDIDSREPNTGDNLIKRTLKSNSFHGPLWGETLQKASGPAKLHPNSGTANPYINFTDLRNKHEVMKISVEGSWAEFVNGTIKGTAPTADNPEGFEGGKGGAAIGGRYHRTTGNTSNNVIKGSTI